MQPRSTTKRLTVALLSAALTLHAVAATAAPGFKYRVPLRQADGPTYKADAAVIESLTASYASVTAGAGTVVELLALLKDSTGVAAPNGQAVGWSTTGGHLSATTSLTSNGSASANLSGLTQAGSVEVTARASSSGASRTATIQVVADADAAKVVAIEPAASSISAGGGQTTVTARLQDPYGNALGADIPVTWTTTLGTLTATTSKTNSSGVAATTLTSPAQIGTATVTARGARGDAGLAKTVAFAPDSATARVTAFSTSLATIPANGVATTNLTAVVKDVNGNALGAGVPVNWTTTAGSLVASSTTTDATGTASVSLRSGTAATTATITAKGAGGDTGLSKTVTFAPDATTARVSNTQTNTATAWANGGPAATLTTTLKDASGNIIPGGTVNWSTTLGTIAGSSVANASGVATAVLNAPTTTGTANVRAWGVAADSGQTVQVNFIPDASTGKVSGTQTNATVVYANGAAAATLTTTLKDARGNLIPGGTVRWSTTAGSIVASSVANASGVASAVLYAPTVAGVANVRAWGVDGDAGQSVAISAVANPNTARPAQVAASPANICGYTGVAGWTYATTVYAVMVDAYGNRLGAGVPVTWTTDRGSLNSGQWGVTYTDASGVAYNTLNASTDLWVYDTVTAYAVDGSGAVAVYQDYCKGGSGGGKG